MPGQRHLQPRPARAASDDVHRDRAVGEQHALPDIQIVGKGGVRRGQADGDRRRAAGSFDQDKLRVAVALDDPACDRAQPDLGAAKVLQDGELGLGLGGKPADRLERGGVRLRACHARS